MKADLHPDYHEITVVMTDGTEFITRSTYQKAGAKLHLDIDPKTHPAWTGQHRLLNRGGQLEKFNKRFAGIGGKKDAAEAGAEPAAAAPAEAAPVAKADKIKLTTTKSSAKKA